MFSIRFCLTVLGLNTLVHSASHAASEQQQTPGGANVTRPQRVSLTDDWVMAQHVECGEVRGRLRAVGLATAADTLLRPVVSASVRWASQGNVVSKASPDSAPVTGEDGIFALSSPTTGTGRLEIVRPGLPDVAIPLDFSKVRGYVIEIAVAGSHTSDERWGTVYQVLRPARGCSVRATDARSELVRRRGSKGDRISRLLDFAAAVAVLMDAIRSLRGSMVPVVVGLVEGRFG